MSNVNKCHFFRADVKCGAFIKMRARIAILGCWASGGCANVDKLLLFRVQLCGSRMVYGVDTPVLTDLGPLPVGKRGLRLTGVPLVSGEIWAAPIDKAVCRLRLIRAGIHRLRPTYLLALRIVLE